VERQVGLVASRLNVDGAWETAIVLLGDRDVGGEGQRTVGSEQPEEPGDAPGIGDVCRREDAAVHDREVAVRHLTPLPVHSFPESPVVIVVAGCVLDPDCVAADAKHALKRACQHRHDVPRYPSAGAMNRCGRQRSAGGGIERQQSG